ncbi:putative carboxylesterase 8 [Platanthera guangdongensis]|uniref:Carboxylesterase 8 n=1 Tax=Platanthera guangdongensis TaxID=2320717 RepID=A0ABR2LLS9_9ASPA
MDPFTFLKISLNTDGSLTRHGEPPTSPASASDPSLPALSKDVLLNPDHGTWIRIFLPSSPRSAAHSLPIILYFHGGGFILFSAATALFHTSCSRVAASLPALVLAVEYRLAPEHRLPAAYHDAHDALLWVRDQALNPSIADPWLRTHANFSRCFLMGSSSGGNIAYRAALRAAVTNLEPLKLEGVLLNQPYFGGERRTESEERMAEDHIVPLAANDLMWDLALPVGASREHEFCNPTAKEEAAAEKLPPCLVRGYLGDPLIDRQRDLAQMLEKKGVRVVGFLEEEGHHAIELFKPDKADVLVEQVREFVCGIASIHKL